MNVLPFLQRVNYGLVGEVVEVGKREVAGILKQVLK